MEEIWKAIEELEGYQVSNLGRIRSVDRIIYAVNRWGDVKPRRYKGKMITLHPNPKGYINFVCKINSKQTNVMVHRLVAKAFVPGYFDGAVVNHKDENKANNRADNLEWVTDHENRIYGTAQERLHKSQCRPIDQLDKDGKYIQTFPSIREAARAVGSDIGSIRKVLKGRGKTIKGFRWKYADE